CQALATTGEKAASVIAMLTETELPKGGEYCDCLLPMPDGECRKFRHWRMPSSSRAYPMKLEAKAEFYKRMLTDIGLV
ncbi:MAG: uracil-DNA glycosylase family protein, partial [Muribaculaceae bacterium]|nr:uracil-DNA glycosylase family protein [Muribaculaceae bacterium]